MLDLRNYDEMCCAVCGKPLIVRTVSEAKARFEGCGRRCRKLYEIPEGSVMFGAIGAPNFIYAPKLVQA